MPTTTYTNALPSVVCLITQFWFGPPYPWYPKIAVPSAALPKHARYKVTTFDNQEERNLPLPRSMNDPLRVFMILNASVVPTWLTTHSWNGREGSLSGRLALLTMFVTRKEIMSIWLRMYQ